MAAKRAAKKTTRPARKALVRAGTGLPAGYAELLDDLKSRVRSAQLKAAVSVNRELIQLYWDIGRLIVERQRREGWGQAVIQRLADDVQKAFPGLGGFSRSNIFRMRAFFLAYSREIEGSAQAVSKSTASKVAQPVGQLPKSKVAQAVRHLDGPPLPAPLAEIPWGHNVVLIEKLANHNVRLWYAQKTVEYGWSRAVLTVQIEANLHGRQGKAVSNFAATLPAPQSDLAQQTLKDPYLFDFLTIGPEAHERDLEEDLLAHIQRFLLELGVGFAFVGRQVPVQVGDESFSIDLLFYHLRLRAFVVIDLKMEPFQPEFAGKMNFYLSAVDDQMRHPDDQPSIGLILCKRRDRIIAEYALRDLSKPIGVSEWQTKLVQSLPKNLQGKLPTIEQIEAELGGEQ
jgi:predicted nuclease of restriction endonuclease-like (RecB) superfamily